MDRTVSFEPIRRAKRDTLKKRLSAELGSPVEIELKGKKFSNNVITGITDVYMRAGAIFVPFHRPSVITIGKADGEWAYREAAVHVKGIGTVTGILVRSGADYIELESEEADRIVRRIIPINRYTQLVPEQVPSDEQ